MKNDIKADAWKIIEEGFDPHLNKISESIFSLGNGRFGQRGNFEETFSGETLQGNYVAGIYYPDKTRVGWWKNGYPEYFAKVLNAANWIGLEIKIESEILDLAKVEVKDFQRVLDMRRGVLQRQFSALLKNGKRIQVNAERFCSIANDEIGAIKYEIIADFDGSLEIAAFIDGTIKNQDSNYDETFWHDVASETTPDQSYLTLRTKKTEFEVCTGAKTVVHVNGQRVEATAVKYDKFVGHKFIINVKRGDLVSLTKIACHVTSQNHDKQHMTVVAKKLISETSQKGYHVLLKAQEDAWKQKWEESDIVIEGDIKAQQAIRFNIFQLYQTYTGKDARLNIGPKGFTGEKYGGSTYWDTEAYCVPFYLATAPAEVCKNLLIYRYNHLQKAIENAQKLGFDGGAALYPMVTMNGEECHNEWEITFEEIHRNGAIAFAIYNYIRYTGDESYLATHGLEVLIGIARFWKQRINWSDKKQQYVMLGVTGPNEYENNINNNWYTNTIAVWCLKYAIESMTKVKELDADQYQQLLNKTNFRPEELKDWAHIIEKMYYPHDDELDIFLQQDGYLDKEQILVSDLPTDQRPINQKWSWDRILRSCFIKQADVLQGLYFFEDQFDQKTIRKNFDFYEPRTVHESSLSPCVHGILAAKIGYNQKAYEMYLRTARLDLDNYNNDTEDGLHITSMAGTWMSVVEGFAGMRVKDGKLHFNPIIPESWTSYAFKIGFRGHQLQVKVTADETIIKNLDNKKLTVCVNGDDIEV